MAATTQSSSWFTAIPRELLAAGDDEFFGEPGFRFWILSRSGEPVLCFEHETGSAWALGGRTTFHLMALYEQSRRHLLVTALKLLRRVDHV